MIHFNTKALQISRQEVLTFLVLKPSKGLLDNNRENISAIHTIVSLEYFIMITSAPLNTEKIK